MNSRDDYTSNEWDSHFDLKDDENEEGTNHVIENAGKRHIQDTLSSADYHSFSHVSAYNEGPDLEY
jgi:hypothetical protein